MAKSSLPQGSQDLIEFLDQFTGLLEYQLLQVRESLESTVSAIMEAVSGISETVDDGRRSAEESLEKTYLKPDPETQVMVEDLQSMIDEVFEQAQNHKEEHVDCRDKSSIASTPDILLQNRIQRFSQRFAREMDDLKTNDTKLSELIMGIVGALSSEDVMAQRIDHSILGLKVLQTGISYVLIDYETRCTVDHIAKIKSDMCLYMFKQYHSEEEKQEYYKFFPDQ